MKSQEQFAADMLWKASKLKTAIPPIKTVLTGAEATHAYKVQAININRRVKDGAKRIGKKIGLTSKAVQAQLGVDQPDFGVLLNDMQILDDGLLRMSDLMQPKAEAEFAFVMQSDITESIDAVESIQDYVEAIFPAIEIVGSRIADWKISFIDTVADNASASHFVLGKKSVKPQEIDLIQSGMKLFKNDVVESEGTGSACLGSPYIALQWLANTLIELGDPILKGDIILSGAIGPMVNIQAGDRLQADFDLLGSVSFEVV